MTKYNPAQPQRLHRFLRLFCAVALVLQAETCAVSPVLQTEAKRRRRKISVPVGYKFSPTDGDLVNHHLKHKLMNVPQQQCLIPEYNLYEVEPWDLITKYNELSVGESNNDECFFFSTNRSSSKRVHRRTPNGHWHETSGTKTIQGRDGVSYVMRYFTFKIGQRQNNDSTAWRMREFTDPSNKELALCKIFKDVDAQKKKKGGRPSSVIPEPSTSPLISPGSQTPEVYADMAGEARTPTSASLTSSNLVSPQSNPNPMDYDMIAPHQQRPMEDRYQPSQNACIAPHQQRPTEDRYQPSLNAVWDPRPCDQFSDSNLMKDGVVSPHHQQPMHTEEGSLLAQVDGFFDFIDLFSTPDDEYNNDPLYLHNVTPNTDDVPRSKRPQTVEGTSLEASEQPPMKKSRIQVTDSQNLELPPSKCGYSLQQSHMECERNLSYTNNSPFSSSMSFPQGNNMLIGYGSEEVNLEEVASRFNPPASPRNLESSNYMGSSQSNHQITSPIFGTLSMWQEKDIEDLLDSPSNGLSLDEIPTTNGTNNEGHSNPSPSNYSTYDTSEPTTGIHEAQQPNQQQELSELFLQQQSPTQPWYNGLQWRTDTPQQMDMPIISEESDIDEEHQYLKVNETYSPLFRW